jgi:hypothetical protein
MSPGGLRPESSEFAGFLIPGFIGLKVMLEEAEGKYL